jgi:glyoxylase-like metal-dependent hydrolase (beta-lactamase superfamily II)
MEEIAPGIRHWTARHPHTGMDASSYWLPDLGVLIDALAVPDEVEGVEEILLSNRHHLRGSLEAHERFHATVRAPRVGMHEFDDGDRIEPYDFGDRLAGGEVIAYEVNSICPDEAALFVPSAKALSVADGVTHYGEELEFVSDYLMDAPEQTKKGLKRAYARLCDELDFEHLLPAHGTPIAGDGRERLREFARGA